MLQTNVCSPPDTTRLSTGLMTRPAFDVSVACSALACPTPWGLEPESGTSPGLPRRIHSRLSAWGLPRHISGRPARRRYSLAFLEWRGGGENAGDRTDFLKCGMRLVIERDFPSSTAFRGRFLWLGVLLGRMPSPLFPRIRIDEE